MVLPLECENCTQILLTGRPQSQIEAAGVLLKLSGEPACMQLLCETPGTFQVLVDMLGLTSRMASESSSALCYRIALERQYRPELGGTGKCLGASAYICCTSPLWCVSVRPIFGTITSTKS